MASLFFLTLRILCLVYPPISRGGNGSTDPFYRHIWAFWAIYAQNAHILRGATRLEWYILFVKCFRQHRPPLSLSLSLLTVVFLLTLITAILLICPRCLKTPAANRAIVNHPKVRHTILALRVHPTSESWGGRIHRPGPKIGYIFLSTS